MKNQVKNFRPLAVLLLLLLLTKCTDFDDRLEEQPTQVIDGTGEIIQKDSELYNLLVRVTSDSADPLEAIICLDFVYPFTLLIYDSNFQVIGTQFLTGDVQFSAFLDGLAPNQAISISYPITTLLEDGTTFTVTNNTELKFAIDSCSQEDIVSYYNSFFCTSPNPALACSWSVDYSENSDNRYVGGTFLIQDDGDLVFNYNHVDYIGTWVFVFVDNDLHLNINLAGSSQVATDWSIDRKITQFNDRIIIHGSTANINLKRNCQSPVDYETGDAGPQGGIVFYDKGSYSEGWRYIETTSSDLGFFQWGCVGTSISNAFGTAIGDGLLNTAAIVNYHDGIGFYTNPAVCNASNNGTVAAKNAILFNAADSNDWFLPSENELFLMYQNLHLENLGGFSNGSYWSSTESDADNARTIDFSNGNHLVTPKIPPTNSVYVRAVRYF